MPFRYFTLTTYPIMPGTFENHYQATRIAALDVHGDGFVDIVVLRTQPLGSHSRSL